MNRVSFGLWVSLGLGLACCPIDASAVIQSDYTENELGFFWEFKFDMSLIVFADQLPVKAPGTIATRDGANNEVNPAGEPGHWWKVSLSDLRFTTTDPNTIVFRAQHVIKPALHADALMGEAFERSIDVTTDLSSADQNNHLLGSVVKTHPPHNDIYDLTYSYSEGPPGFEVFVFRFSGRHTPDSGSSAMLLAGVSLALAALGWCGAASGYNTFRMQVGLQPRGEDGRPMV